MSFGWLGLGLVTIPTLISQWFTHKRGLAISLALNGASFGGIVVAPLLVLLIGITGFTAAMLIAAAVMVVILVPVGARLGAGTRRPRSGAGRARDRLDAARRAAQPAVLDRVGIVLAGAARAGRLHRAPDRLHGAAGRARAGRAVGVDHDRDGGDRPPHARRRGRPARPAADLVRLDVQPGGRAVLHDPPTDPTLLLAACAAYGFSVGNIITLPSLIMQREFPAASFGVVLGLSTAIGTFAGALGPGLIGLIRDATGDYGAALLLCMALKIAGGAFVLVRQALTPSRSFRGIPQTRAAFIKFPPQSGRHIRATKSREREHENACGHLEIPPPDRATGASQR